MHLIVLHPPKGVGESTLARELAVAADRPRAASPWQTSTHRPPVTGWYRRRQAKTPPLVAFSETGDTAPLVQAPH